MTEQFLLKALENRLQTRRMPRVKLTRKKDSTRHNGKDIVNTAENMQRPADLKGSGYEILSSVSMIWVRTESTVAACACALPSSSTAPSIDASLSLRAARV